MQIKISGPEMVEYLNGIITLDLDKITPDKQYRSAFLTPKGKIRSIFWIQKSNDTVILYASPEFKQNLVEDLLKYKLSMDVKLEDITDEVDALYLIANEEKIPGLSNEELGFILTNSDETPPGNEISYNRFIELLVKNGITPHTVMMDQNPYELGISDIISLEKGCFLGQEPISRMYHRGNPRKYVYHLRSEGRGSVITSGDKEVGQIICNSGDFALGFINRTIENLENLYLEDHKVEVIKRVGAYPENTRN